MPAARRPLTRAWPDSRIAGAALNPGAKMTQAGQLIVALHPQ
jgi:hypothetical protein